MPTGRVKWFNNAKGYGFILPNEGGEDHFAHYSAIKMGGYRSLKAGQAVQFDCGIDLPALAQVVVECVDLELLDQ